MTALITLAIFYAALAFVWTMIRFLFVSRTGGTLVINTALLTALLVATVGTVVILFVE